ncbi:MAG: hypothetical protein M1820_007766 [Bogoriella megaspora]|nr:MAG: hypothetical protein M1820_007766 [Bogoriella megaspora]
MEPSFGRILWTVVFLRLSAAQNCDIPPIYVDIHNRNVTGSAAFQYGSFIGVGSPAWNQSLWPSLIRNETTVADAHFCNHSKLADCGNGTQGFFDPNVSTTWQPNHSYTAKDSSTGDNVTFGQDTLHMYTHFYTNDPASDTNVTNFTISLATGGDENPGIVGLGPSSTLLQTLVDKSMIAGKTVSIYPGNAMNRTGGDAIGSTIYGGFDSSRFTGEIHKSTMDPYKPSPFTVTVVDIKIDDLRGDGTSLLDRARFPNLSEETLAFDAEISMDDYEMFFPYEITQNFRSLLKAGLGANVAENDDESLVLSSPFDGSMTITLSNGFSVTLPGNITSNGDNVLAVKSRDKNSTAPFILGISWLTQVYLMIDYDHSVFYTAQVIPEVPFNTPRTFCPGVLPVQYQPPHMGGLDTAGIAGAVVGGVIGGIALLTLAFCIWRAWMQRRVQRFHRLGNEKIIEMTERGERDSPSPDISHEYLKL